MTLESLDMVARAAWSLWAKARNPSFFLEPKPQNQVKNPVTSIYGPWLRFCYEAPLARHVDRVLYTVNLFR